MIDDPIPLWFRLALVLRAPIRWRRVIVGAILCLLPFLIIAMAAAG